MRSPTASTKGQSQPVWILVAVLLAVIVAVTMYRLVQRGEAGEFEGMQREISTSYANTMFEDKCMQWKRMSWSAMSRPSADEEAKFSIEMYAWRANRILSREEIESASKVNVCDCAVFLYKRRSLDYGEMLQLWKEHKDCNSWAMNTGCADNLCGTASGAEQCKKDHGCTSTAS